MITYYIDTNNKLNTINYFFNDLVLGYLIFEKISNYIYISYIFIEHKYRGKQYLSCMLKILYNLNPNITEYYLDLKEECTRHKRLENYYNSFNFNSNGKSNYIKLGKKKYRMVTMCNIIND